MNLTTENNRKETMNLITEAVLDDAIEATGADLRGAILRGAGLSGKEWLKLQLKLQGAIL